MGPEPRRCSRYVDPFLEEVDHAAPPADKTSKEWVRFGVEEAGAKEQDTRDKRLGKKVLHTCEDETQEAFDRAAKAVKPWYKRIF